MPSGGISWHHVTYPESSTPFNDRRHELLGYRPHSKVQLETGAVVQTYWREPRVFATPAEPGRTSGAA